MLTPAGKAFVQNTNLSSLVASVDNGRMLDCPFLVPNAPGCPPLAVASIQVRVLRDRPRLAAADMRFTCSVCECWLLLSATTNKRSSILTLRASGLPLGVGQSS